jgi:hypothetical protein
MGVTFTGDAPMGETRLSRREAILAGLSAAAWAGGARAESSAPLTDAFYFAFPRFEFARSAWAAAAQTPNRPQARWNQVNHRRGFSDHTARVVTTPNNDTIYSSAWFDLTNGIVVLEAPTVLDRYLSMAFLDAQTDNFAAIGTRATGGAGGLFALVGPDWRGAVPRGTLAIRSPSNDVWMIARILADGRPDDVAAANAIQDQIRVVDAPAPSPPQIAPSQASDWENLLSVVNERLARQATAQSFAGSRAALRRWGVHPGSTGVWSSLQDEVRAAWRAQGPAVLATLVEGFAAGGETVHNWRYPPATIGSASASDFIRSAVALSGLGALNREEATYARCDIGPDGAALDGGRRYALKLPDRVPVRAFWSLSMYAHEPDGRLFFAENPLGRFAIGDRTPGLHRDPDGGLTIHMSHEEPADGVANWLPAPAGRFSVVFRTYLPETEILSGTWRIPEIMAVG